MRITHSIYSKYMIIILYPSGMDQNETYHIKHYIYVSVPLNTEIHVSVHSIHPITDDL